MRERGTLSLDLHYTLTVAKRLRNIHKPGKAKRSERHEFIHPVLIF
jgi:hypothetical protein